MNESNDNKLAICTQRSKHPKEKNITSKMNTPFHTPGLHSTQGMNCIPSPYHPTSRNCPLLPQRSCALPTCQESSMQLYTCTESLMAFHDLYLSWTISNSALGCTQQAFYPGTLAGSVAQTRPDSLQYRRDRYIVWAMELTSYSAILTILYLK